MWVVEKRGEREYSVRMKRTGGRGSELAGATGHHHEQQGTSLCDNVINTAGDIY
jgi:hypothetical protein